MYPQDRHLKELLDPETLNTPTAMASMESTRFLKQQPKAEVPTRSCAIQLRDGAAPAVPPARRALL